MTDQSNPQSLYSEKRKQIIFCMQCLYPPGNRPAISESHLRRPPIKYGNGETVLPTKISFPLTQKEIWFFSKVNVSTRLRTQNPSLQGRSFVCEEIEQRLLSPPPPSREKIGLDLLRRRPFSLLMREINTRVCLAAYTKTKKEASS